MPITKFSSSLASQKVAGPEHVLDLPTVQRHLRHLVELFAGEPADILITKELRPDLPSGLRVELWVAQRHVDARFERRIDILRAVAGEE